MQYNKLLAFNLEFIQAERGAKPISGLSILQPEMCIEHLNSQLTSKQEPQYNRTTMELTMVSSFSCKVTI